MASDNKLTPNVLTLTELADYLRVHPSTIYRLLGGSSLPCFRVGTDWRFVCDDIDRCRLGQPQAVAAKN